MSPRHKKFRPLGIAGVTTAVVVGSAGAVLAFGPWAGHDSSNHGSTDQTSLASSISGRQPTSAASVSATPGSQTRRHVHRGHHGHRRPTGRPTVSPTTPTATPTTTAPRPTTPTANPTTTAPRPTTPTANPTTTAPRPTTPTANPTTPPTSGGSQTQQYQAEVIRLVNVERSKSGCNALTANAALTKAAQDHAMDMLAHNYFSHDSQNGTSPFQRMTAAGYRWSGAAENIAAGQRTPADVMVSWMNSAGHRANILNCGLKDIGVGYAAGSGAAYGQYWVQDFGSPA